MGVLTSGAVAGVLLGASGRGKTTLLNLVAGLERPTSGAVRVGGMPGLTDTANPPSGNPNGGGVLYTEAGSLKWQRSDGTVTVIAPA